MSNRKQEKEKEIMMSMDEIMDVDLPEDDFERLTGIDLDEPDNEEEMARVLAYEQQFDDEISPEELLDAEIEAKGLNPRRMEDVEKYFKMKEGEE